MTFESRFPNIIKEEQFFSCTPSFRNWLRISHVADVLDYLSVRSKHKVNLDSSDVENSNQV